jgi:trigger factor
MEDLNVKLEDVSSISKKITVQVPYSKVQVEMEKALEKVAQTAVIKGFRKGKAPKAVIEKQYADSIRYDVTENLINETYADVLKKHNLVPVGYPNISDVVLKDNEPFTYEAIIEIRPQVEAKHYTDIKVEAITAQPTEEEVDKIVESFLDSKAEMKTVIEERPVMDGDWVDIDLDGEIGGVKQDNLTIKAYVCQIGNKTGLLEDLSKGVKGMRAGEEKNVKSTYDKEYYSEDLRGKEVNFKVKLNKILDRVLPVLTEELIKDAKLATSKDEFLNNIRENLKRRKEDVRQNSMKAQVIDHLLEKNKFDVPNAEVERKLPEIRERAVRNIFGYQTPNMPENEMKDILDKHEDEFKKAAENDVRLSYIIEAIAKKENISATEDELKQELEGAAQAMKMTVTDLKSKYGARNLEYAVNNSIIERKTFDYLYEKAKITEKKEK